MGIDLFEFRVLAELEYMFGNMGHPPYNSLGLLAIGASQLAKKASYWSLLAVELREAEFRV